MKHTLITLSAILISVSLTAQEPVKLGSQADSLQYSLGVFVGQWLINNGFAVQNKEIFNRGMDDLMLDRQRAITDSTIVPIIT